MDITLYRRISQAAQYRQPVARIAVAIVATSCGQSPQVSADGTTATSTSATVTGGAGTDSTPGTATSTGETTGTGVSEGSSASGDSWTSGAPPEIDAGVPPPPFCKVPEGDDHVPTCREIAPPDSFSPEQDWAWFGDEMANRAIAIPLVANLTDDNDDGDVDLCDVPDIVIPAYWAEDDDGSHRTISEDGYLYILDGATGTVHQRTENLVVSNATPAIGDITGDSTPEIVAAVPFAAMGGSRAVLAAFTPAGEILWKSDDIFYSSNGLSGLSQAALALADLDADGDVEIIVGDSVTDHEGTRLWDKGASKKVTTATAADLDDDGDLEVIVGTKAYHHDGEVYYDVGGGAAHPHVADMDGDQLPEVVIVMGSGIIVVEHDGTVSLNEQLDPPIRRQPSAIHNMLGDESPEIALGYTNDYQVRTNTFDHIWSAVVADGGQAGGTAFDFLGDGTAEAMYADETTLYIFDETGTPLLTAARESWTSIENPIVADVDNDSAADIVVPSNNGFTGGNQPALQVIRDTEDRWVPARRIWNQHTYHVTNVREDGTIPQVEPKSWETFNTFRTQAQVENGSTCTPAM